jgi:hypothetical protein
MSPPSDLRQLVLERVKREPAPPRAAIDLPLLGRVAVAVLIASTLFLALGGVRPGGRPAAFVAGTALGWASFAVAATWGAFGRGRSMLGRPRKSLVAVAVATPLGMLAWAVFFDQLYPEVSESLPLRAAVLCFVLTLAFGAAPLAALALTRKDSDPLHPRATGAALGAAAGAWGGVMIDLVCEHAAPSHVALGHVLPIVLLCGVGAWLGRLVIALRPEP